MFDILDQVAEKELFDLFQKEDPDLLSVLLDHSSYFKTTGRLNKSTVSRSLGIRVSDLDRRIKRFRVLVK